MHSARPHLHWHDSHRFCTTNCLPFFFYHTRCRASILARQYRMNMPVATVMRCLFKGGALGYYHSPIHPLPDILLQNPIRIVDLDADTWWDQLEGSLGKRDAEIGELCVTGMELHKDG